jgi:helix-turn-helix, Psq domain
MQVQTNEARIILAIEAVRSSKTIKAKTAARLYNVSETTLYTRLASRPSRSDYRPKVQKLTELEENVIVQHIFDLDSRGFSPRLANVEDIANYLLKTRRAKRIGKL